MAATLLEHEILGIHFGDPVKREISCWNEGIDKHSACSCMCVCGCLRALCSFAANVCACVCSFVYVRGFYAAKTVVLPEAKRTINFRALVESLFHSCLWNQCRELRLPRLELCSISYQLIVLAITTTIASICTHTYIHTHT